MPVWGVLLERAASSSPTTPVDALTRLARTSTDATVLTNLAVNPSSNEETLLTLVSPPVGQRLSPWAWDAVAKHANCTPEVAAALARSYPGTTQDEAEVRS
jgi:hypothetical protein